MGVGSDQNLISHLVEHIHCRTSNSSFSYLELPVGFLMSSKKNWKPLIDKIATRLSTWMEKTLSMGEELP